ncbi:MAG: hypothetical protein RLZZ609_2309 [Cyanobacteriota bacterium]|jgi:hypothetical protein
MAKLAGAVRPLARQAGGLALAGGWLAALALMAPLARASSPEAWRAYEREVRQACLAASGLKAPRVVGQRVDVPELSLSVLLLAGRYPQAHMAGRAGRELCLFTQEGRRAVIAVADGLDQPLWPSPPPGGMVPAASAGERGPAQLSP